MRLLVLALVLVLVLAVGCGTTVIVKENSPCDCVPCPSPNAPEESIPTPTIIEKVQHPVLVHFYTQIGNETTEVCKTNWTIPSPEYSKPSDLWETGRVIPCDYFDKPEEGFWDFGGDIGFSAYIWYWEPEIYYYHRIIIESEWGRASGNNT